MNRKYKSLGVKLLLGQTGILSLFFVFLITAAYINKANSQVLVVFFAALLIMLSTLVLIIRKHNNLAKFILIIIPPYALLTISIIEKSYNIFSNTYSYLIPRLFEIIYLMTPVILFGLKEYKKMLISLFILIPPVFLFAYTHQLFGVNVEQLIGNKTFYNLFLGMVSVFYGMALISILLFQKRNILFRSEFYLKSKGIIDEKEELMILNCELRESEEKYRNLTETMRDVVVSISIRGKVLYVSPSIKEFGGYTPEEGIGKHISKFIANKTDLLRAIKVIAEILISRKNGNFEFIYKAKTKKPFPVELSYFPFVRNNKVESIELVMRDITERKKAEQVLKQSKAHIQSIISSLNDLVFVIDKNGCFSDFYKPEEDTKLYTPPEKFIGIHYKDFLPSYIADKTEKALKKIELGEETQQFDYFLKTGELLQWFNAKFSAFKNSEGEFEGIIAIVRDITERKLTENSLKESEKRFKALSEATFEAIFITEKGIGIDANKEASRMFGYSYNEMVGKFGTDIIAPESKEFVRKNILSDIENTYEAIALRKDGTKFHAEIQGKMFEYKGNKVRVTALKDISERKNIEQRIKNKNVKLKETYITLKKAHKDITANIEYAKSIQEALLTPERFIKTYFKDHFLLYKPKDQISGDFYYMNKINDFIIFTVADCTGHGIPGGLLSMIGITYIHEIVRYKDIKKASEVLNLLRQRIKATFRISGYDNQNGLDIAFCAINTKTNVLQYSGAFNPLVIVRENELKEYKATRNPVGFYPIETNFKNNEIKLQDNDKIYLFSDGYKDQIGGNESNKYNNKRFKELIFNVSNYPLNKQKEVLSETLEKWQGENEQIDDVTVLGVKWRMLKTEAF